MEKLLKLSPFIFLVGVSFFAALSFLRVNSLRKGEYIPVGINNVTFGTFLLADEVFNFDQIIRLASFNPSLNPSVSTLPGYHIAIAGIVKLLKDDRALTIRLIGVIVNLTLIFAFYLTAKKLNKTNSYLKTLEFVFFPLIFPFFPILYTDLFSITFVLFSFLFILKRRFLISGIFALISLFIRQTNVIWVLFYLLFSFGEIDTRKINLQEIIRYFAKMWVFILCLLLFALFVMINKGVPVSIGEKSMHPVSFNYLGNIYFFLFSFFFLFLPLNIANFSKVVELIFRRKVIIVIFFAGIFFFMRTFVNDHPYNQIHQFLRNDILMFFTEDVLLKAIFYVISFYSLLSLLVTKLVKKEYYFIYLFALFLLLGAWLIEPRYFIIPLTFFILFRKTETKIVEYSTVLLNTIVSLVFLTLMMGGNFFI